MDELTLWIGGVSLSILGIVFTEMSSAAVGLGLMWIALAVRAKR